MRLRKLRRRRAGPRRRGAMATERRNDYRAVAILPGADPCGAVAQLEGRRILTRFIHLFPLPLPECDAARCECRYRHYADRRGEDRRLPYGSGIRRERRHGGDRRRSPLRRASDVA